jgi:hypothetical protein
MSSTDKRQALSVPHDAYLTLGFAVTIIVMLAIGYRNAAPEVIFVSAAIALAALADATWTLYRREQLLDDLITSKMQKPTRRSASANSAVKQVQQPTETAQ